MCPPKIRGLVSGLTVKHKLWMNSQAGRLDADLLMFTYAGSEQFSISFRYLSKIMLHFRHSEF